MPEVQSYSHDDYFERPDKFQRARLARQRTRAADVRSNIVKQEISADIRSQNASAMDALQEAREILPGAQRSDALKGAGTLRTVTG